MSEPFENLKIHFVTDDNELVTPITNYFSEKIFEGECDELFHLILQNKSLECYWTVIKKFLIVSIDNLKNLDKNFVENFHNVCLYKNNFALTFDDVKKIYNSKKITRDFLF